MAQLRFLVLLEHKMNRKIKTHDFKRQKEMIIQTRQLLFELPYSLFIPVVISIVMYCDYVVFFFSVDTTVQEEIAKEERIQGC